MLDIESKTPRAQSATRHLPLSLALGAALLTAPLVAPRVLAKDAPKKVAVKKPDATKKEIAKKQATKVWRETGALKSADSNLRVSPDGMRTPLDDYIARAEPVYEWHKVAATDKGKVKSDNPLAALVDILGAGTTREEIEMTSQQWQGTTWTHRLTIFRPEKSDFADTAIIYVTFGDAVKPEEIAVGAAVAKQTGATFVNLSGIPKQPLWGFKEDGLISYTFEQYMKTGDATWPLLLPMTKSVVKTMDAISEYSRQPGRTPIRRFVILGASKRGWTTWLAGAVDKRVIGIVPIVYDNLNLAKQMPRQLETWGKYSAQIQEYTDRGLQAQLTTPRGQQLGAMVDPWTYRDRLTMPKLIVNGTNDPYWTLGALNVYIDDLRGPTNVLYAPNGGHDLGGMAAAQLVLQSVGGWFRRVAANKPVPTAELLSDVSSDAKTSLAKEHKTQIANVLDKYARTFIVTTDAAKVGETATRAKLWVARSATRDFRQAQWTSIPMQNPNNTVFTAAVPAPPENDDSKYAAAYGEIELAPNASSTIPTFFSTTVTQWQTRE